MTRRCSAEAPPDDPVRLKLVRFMVMAMILAMAWRVLPMMGALSCAPAPSATLCSLHVLCEDPRHLGGISTQSPKYLPIDLLLLGGRWHTRGGMLS